MATKSTLTIFADADISVRVDVKTTDGGASAQTMTGWALAFAIRDHAGNAVVTKTTSSGITIGNGDGTDDRATIAIADTDTTNWPEGLKYRWSLWRTDAGSDIPLAYGPCTILEAADQP